MEPGTNQVFGRLVYTLFFGERQQCTSSCALLQRSSSCYKSTWPSQCTDCSMTSGFGRHSCSLVLHSHFTRLVGRRRPPKETIQSTYAVNSSIFCFWKLLFVVSRPPQTIGIFAEMSVLIWKGGFVVDTLLGHQNFGPNVVFQSLDLYISSVPSSTGGHGRPREAPWRQREATDASSHTDVGPRIGNVVLSQRRQDP